MMENQFLGRSQRDPVTSQHESPASSIEQTAANNNEYCDSNDPVYFGLTDFRREHVITVEADSPVETALNDMNRMGVHALLVTRQEVESTDQQVVGLITFYDIQRSRPHRLPRALVGGKALADEHRVIRVGEVMTPWNELPLVRYESLRSLSETELYGMFQGTGLTHLLVVESDDNGGALARGLLSRAALAKRLYPPPAVSVR